MQLHALFAGMSTTRKRRVLVHLESARFHCTTCWRGRAAWRGARSRRQEAASPRSSEMRGGCQLAARRTAEVQRKMPRTCAIHQTNTLMRGLGVHESVLSQLRRKAGVSKVGIAQGVC